MTSGARSKPPRSRAKRWRRPGPESAADGRWLIAGWNGVRECLASPAVELIRLWVDGRRVSSAQRALLAPHGSLIEELVNGETPYGEAAQGVAALVRPPRWPDVDALLDRAVDAGRAPLLVALDQVEDPMNLGQILRTCEGAGVDAVLTPGRRAAHLNQTAAQVSQGAFAWAPALEVGNLSHALKRLKTRGLWVVGCDAGPGSQSWDRCHLREPAVLVFGAEGRGLRALTRKTCDVLARLPMRGRLESLNVGASVAAFVYEAVRQRMGAGS